MILPDHLDARALWLAVIDRAVKDLSIQTPDAHDAWEWLFLPSSFAEVCDKFGLDPAAFRAKLRARGLGTEPERYVARPRILQPGIGRGHWTHQCEIHCVACLTVFTALRPDTRYCLGCQRQRAGVRWKRWKRRRAA